MVRVERPTSIRKTQVRIPAGLRCVFSSGPAVSSSVFVGEKGRNLIVCIIFLVKLSCVLVVFSAQRVVSAPTNGGDLKVTAPSRSPEDDRRLDRLRRERENREAVRRLREQERKNTVELARERQQRERREIEERRRRQRDLDERNERRARAERIAEQRRRAVLEKERIILRSFERRDRERDVRSRRDRSPLRRTGRDRSPLRRPGRDQSPSRRPGREQSPSRRLARDQSPSRRLARDQSPSRRLARDQSPSRRLARDQSPSRRLARDQSPSRRLARDQSPSRRPGRDQSPSRRPGREQSPSRRPGRDQSPSRRFARDTECDRGRETVRRGRSPVGRRSPRRASPALRRRSPPPRHRSRSPRQRRSPPRQSSRDPRRTPPRRESPRRSSAADSRQPAKDSTKAVADVLMKELVGQLVNTSAPAGDSSKALMAALLTTLATGGTDAVPADAIGKVLHAVDSRPKEAESSRRSTRRSPPPARKEDRPALRERDLPQRGGNDARNGQRERSPWRADDARLPSRSNEGSYERKPMRAASPPRGMSRGRDDTGRMRSEHRDEPRRSSDDAWPSFHASGPSVVEIVRDVQTGRFAPEAKRPTEHVDRPRHGGSRQAAFSREYDRSYDGARSSGAAPAPIQRVTESRDYGHHHPSAPARAPSSYDSRASFDRGVPAPTSRGRDNALAFSAAEIDELEKLANMITSREGLPMSRNAPPMDRGPPAMDQDQSRRAPAPYSTHRPPAQDRSAPRPLMPERHAPPAEQWDTYRRDAGTAPTGPPMASRPYPSRDSGPAYPSRDSGPSYAGGPPPPRSYRQF